MFILPKALSTGKPLSFAPDTIDCEYPDDEEAFVEPDGTRSPSSKSSGFRTMNKFYFFLNFFLDDISDWRSLHIFIKEIQAPLTARVCAAKPPKYSEIREFDRKVVAFETMYATVGAAVKRIPAEQFEKLDRQTKFRFRSLGLLGSLGASRHFSYFVEILNFILLTSNDVYSQTSLRPLSEQSRGRAS